MVIVLHRRGRGGRLRTSLEIWKRDDAVEVVVVVLEEVAGAGVQRVRTIDSSSFSIAGVGEVEGIESKRWSEISGLWGSFF